MKIGIIGLGNIAQKAYLPIIGNMNNIELILCTRNIESLRYVANKYRITQCVNTVEELVNTGIEAVFVHAATEAHIEILEKLISSNIHIYIDKPIANSYDESLKIVKLAEQKNLIFMVGFNRRFAPMYKILKEQSNPDLIIMQKNRVNSLNKIREVIFDDFIHAIDTTRYLMPGDINNMQVNYLVEDKKLYNIIVKLESENCTAVAMMNRNNGINEEVIELMSPGNKLVVRNLEQLTCFDNGEEKVTRHKDWDPILYRRGFQEIIESFLEAVKYNKNAAISPQDALVSHELCEKIVYTIENNIV
ncbi:Gfo/Idh/MocA family protein [Clostridium sp. DJ247]|uniref:Gfo/Idh/MocA family protein n=1 Tax=Clostridium sp. DJ247 TaxID=2726188 RepID=UPI00162A2E95|nr:Gfo/Idh/MocA family oxidoreductase [Clostridium sp. DJ247]MBC2582249.1 Gfo/Idh/MocA family oxidoreductase [Clostridium sp. DJ247]